MNLSFNQVYPPVPYSITNPSFAQSEVRDKSTPFSLLEFIKTVSGLVDSVNISSFYNDYISLWNSVNENKEQSSQEFFVNSYTEFIKEITLNYSTEAERKFLTSIDYSDKYDLEIILSFISKKIKEIALFYSKKREDIKLEPSRKKLKGSYKGFAISLREKILEFFRKQETVGDDLTEATNNVQVYVDELYDVGSDYLNKQPSDLVYDAADRDFFNLDIFLASNQEIFALVYENIPDIIQDYQEKDSLYTNKKELTRKYMGADFYYLSATPVYTILPTEVPGIVTSNKIVQPIKILRRTFETSTSTTTPGPTTRPPTGSTTRTTTTRTTTTRTTTTRTTTTSPPPPGPRTPTTRIVTLPPPRYGWNCIARGTPCVYVVNGRFVSAEACEASCKLTTPTTRTPLSGAPVPVIRITTPTPAGVRWSCVSPSVSALSGVSGTIIVAGDGPCIQTPSGRYDTQSECQKNCTTRTTTTRTTTTRTTTTRTTTNPTTRQGGGGGGGGDGDGGDGDGGGGESKDKKYGFRWCCRAVKTAGEGDSLVDILDGTVTGECAPQCYKFVPLLNQRVEINPLQSIVRKPNDCAIGDFQTEGACKASCRVLYGCTSKFADRRVITGCFPSVNNQGLPLEALSFTSRGAAQAYCNWGEWICKNSQLRQSDSFTDVTNNVRQYASISYTCVRKSKPAESGEASVQKGQTLNTCLAECNQTQTERGEFEGTCNPCNLYVAVVVKPQNPSNFDIKYRVDLNVYARSVTNNGSIKCKNGTGNPATLTYTSIKNPVPEYDAGAFNYNLAFRLTPDRRYNVNPPYKVPQGIDGELIGEGRLQSLFLRSGTDFQVQALLPTYLNVAYEYDYTDVPTVDISHIGPFTGTCKVLVPSFDTLIPGQEPTASGGDSGQLNQAIGQSLGTQENG